MLGKRALFGPRLKPKRALLLHFVSEMIRRNPSGLSSTKMVFPRRLKSNTNAEASFDHRGSKSLANKTGRERPAWLGRADSLAKNHSEHFESKNCWGKVSVL